MANGHIDPNLSEYCKEFLRKCKLYQLDRTAKSFGVELGKPMLMGMNLKKQHEVSRFSPLIHQLSIRNSQESEIESQPERIVDIGAGQGYLDNILVQKFNSKVVAVECNAIQTCGAKLRSEKLGTTNSITIIQEYIDRETDFSCYDPFIICGLHCCGDLTTSALELFINSSCKRIAIVPCCYNRLTNFPLSQPVKKLGINFGLSQRMLATQCPGRWSTIEAVRFYKRNYYRALLELWLNNHGISLATVGKVKESSSFVLYAKEALTKNNLEFDEKELNDFELEHAHHEKTIRVVWTLRSLLSGVLESLILFDFKLYLEESVDAKIEVMALFDQQTSPRNMVLVAEKNK